MTWRIKQGLPDVSLSETGSSYRCGKGRRQKEQQPSSMRLAKDGERRGMGG